MSAQQLKPLSIIVAALRYNRGIGFQGKIPWYCKKDLTYFQTVTTTNTTTTTTNENDKQHDTKHDTKQNAVIMGRKTWDSLPLCSKPLKRRLNIVLTTQPSKYDATDNVIFLSDFQQALDYLNNQSKVNEIFVIGGSKIYSLALQHPQCQKIYYTTLYPPRCKNEKSLIQVDTFFPSFSEDEWQEDWVQQWNETNNLPNHHHNDNVLIMINSGSFHLYTRRPQIINQEEEQYLQLVEQLLYSGSPRQDRTQTGTLSDFGMSMKFNLRQDRFPLLTTKKMFLRGIVEELLWFLRGSTNSQELSKKGVTIWDLNGSRSYLDSLGLTERKEGDLGPIYSFQWRHFGARYQDMNTDYSGQGVDQIAYIIQRLKHHPTDRRIILSAWNPVDLPLQALPPCHVMCQFYVNQQNELSCQMYQRSGDMGLGVPFNIASYSLLTKILAHVCDLKCGDFIHVIGDAHVYKNHIQALQEQLSRSPRPFPRLLIKTQNKDINGFQYKDFELIDYHPYDKIEMTMSV